jgi:hypothetical protein
MALNGPPASALTESASSVDDVRAQLAEKGVKYCLAAYTDVHGVGKAKAASARGPRTTSSR